MTQVCPVTEERINEKITRLNAFLVAGLISVFLYFSIGWIVAFLAVDYFIRGYLKVNISPIKNLSEFTGKRIFSSPKMINAGPKIFAARIGLILTLVISALFFIGFIKLATIFAVVLLFFSSLEAFFGICVACIIYPFFYKQ